MNISLNQETLEEWMLAALSGELSPEQTKVFEDYLAAHPEARRDYEESKVMSRLLEKTFEQARPGADFEERMVRGFRKKKQARDLGFWKWWSEFWRGPKTVYAGALAALVLSFYVGGEAGRQNGSTPKNPPSIVVQNGSAANVEVVGNFKTPVPDGYVSAGKSLELQGGNTYSGTTVVSSGKLAIADESQKADTFADRGETMPSDAEKLNREFKAEMSLGEATTTLSSEQPQINIETKFVEFDEDKTKDKSFTYTKGRDLDRTSEVVVTAGQTEVRGKAQSQDSAAQDAQQPYNEKASEVPVLGDLPVVGRLYAQKDAKSSERESAPKPAKPAPAAPANGPVPLTQVAQNKALIAKGQNLVTEQAQENPASVQRKLIRNASVGLEVKNYASAIQNLSRLAQDEKGFVATQDDRTQANGHSAGQIVIKLPPDRLDAFVLNLRQIGKIQHQVLKTDDVTKAYFDTEARLRNSRKTEDRLLELMAKKTDKVADLLQVEKEIARVRESIEQMQGELKLWDSLSSLATVTIDLVEEDIDQAAAYLLKETASIGLYTSDVEKTYKSAREYAEKTDTQIVSAQVNRYGDGRMSATLSLLAAPERAFLLIEQLKALGRVSSFEQNTERVAQDGTAGISGTTRKDKVEIELSIVHDDHSRKTIDMQVITPEVEKALDQSRKAGTAASGEILVSNLQRGAGGHSQAQLTLRLPADRVEEFKAVVVAQGRVARLTVQRNDEAGLNAEGADKSPVIVSLSLSDEEAPIQVTRLMSEGSAVASKVSDLKEKARSMGAEIRTSSYSRNPDGVELANVVLRLEQKDYEQVMALLQGSGKTLKLSLERRDRPDTLSASTGSEPVEIQFLLKSPAPLVGADQGFTSEIRRTAGRSLELMIRGVERIVTGLAYLLPWALAGVLGWWIWRKVRRKKQG